MAQYTRNEKIRGKKALELYEIVSREIGRFVEKSSIGEAKIECDALAKEVRVKGKMFSATLRCLEEELDLIVSLSLLATPFKGKIDEAITRWIQKTFQIQP